jgi:hypothetical protein
MYVLVFDNRKPVDGSISVPLIYHLLPRTFLTLNDFLMVGSCDSSDTQDREHTISHQLQHTLLFIS